MTAGLQGRGSGLRLTEIANVAGDDALFRFL